MLAVSSFVLVVSRRCPLYVVVDVVVVLMLRSSCFLVVTRQCLHYVGVVKVVVVLCECFVCVCLLMMGR